MTPTLKPQPADVTDQLETLKVALDRVVPAKSVDNLLVATWNVRAFDRVNPTWRTSTGDSPIRDLSNVACIAEIVGRFDVIAIQEVRRSAEAFLTMLQMLGPDWAFLVTDVTEGSAGNNERLAFVFDTHRVKPSGLACELVVPLPGQGEKRLLEQFARTPYAASFARNNHRFTLVTLHVIFGTTEQDRIPELTELAQWLSTWAARKDIWGENLMALGDLNIDHRDDPLYQAFTSTGLQPPPGLNFVPRTIFDDSDPAAPPDHRHFYDQIAWFSTGKAALSLPLVNAGTFDFTGPLVPAETQNQLSWRISDHYPLWCEFSAKS